MFHKTTLYSFLLIKKNYFFKTFICPRFDRLCFLSISLYASSSSMIPIYHLHHNHHIPCFQLGGAVHTFSSSARTNQSLSPTVTVTYIYSSASTWKFPRNDKDNSHTSLHSHEHRSSLTHSPSDAISQIDDLTPEAALGPASTTTHCPYCSYRRPEDKAQRAYPY